MNYLFQCFECKEYFLCNNQCENIEERNHSCYCGRCYHKVRRKKTSIKQSIEWCGEKKATKKDIIIFELTK